MRVTQILRGKRGSLFVLEFMDASPAQGTIVVVHKGEWTYQGKNVICQGVMENLPFETLLKVAI